MKKLMSLGILLVFIFILLGYSLNLDAQEYKAFTGVKLSFSDSIIKNQTCNQEPYYPAFGVAYQQFLNAPPASGGDRTNIQ
jgi:hypothetical protein